jgi:hypothetical protein
MNFRLHFSLNAESRECEFTSSIFLESKSYSYFLYFNCFRNLPSDSHYSFPWIYLCNSVTLLSTSCHHLQEEVISLLQNFQCTVTYFHCLLLLCISYIRKLLHDTQPHIRFTSELKWQLRLVVLFICVYILVLVFSLNMNHKYWRLLGSSCILCFLFYPTFTKPSPSRISVFRSRNITSVSAYTIFFFI